MKKSATQRPKKAKTEVRFSQTPTLEEMDSLLEYLPKLKLFNEPPIEQWITALPDGQPIAFPHPVYKSIIDEFFHLGSASCWMDYDYIANQAEEMLNDSERIRTATLSEWKTMFTFCVRGERFCDGHWASMVENGTITALLERLQYLRATLAEAKF